MDNSLYVWPLSGANGVSRNDRDCAHSGRLMPYKLGLRRVKNDQSTGSDSNSTEYELSIWASLPLSPTLSDPSVFYAKASYSPHGVPRDLPQFGIPSFHCPSPFRAWDIGDDGGQAEQDQYRGYSLNQPRNGPVRSFAQRRCRDIAGSLDWSPDRPRAI